MKKIEQYVLGMVQTNCYLLWNDNHVIIVDPASKSSKLREKLKEAEAIVDAVVLTHGHFDHIAGADAFVKEFKCPLYISEIDSAMLQDTYLNVSRGLTGMEVTIQTTPKYFKTGMNTIGTFEIKVIDAPGHTEGSVMLLWDNNLICGDVLFQGSIGRCDLPTASNNKMHQTLNKIKQMDPDLNIYPGHGPATNLKDELMYNPYLN